MDISQAVSVDSTSADAIGHLIRTLRAELSLVRGAIERMERQVLPLLEDNRALGDAITASQNAQFEIGSEAALPVMEHFSREYPDAFVTSEGSGWKITYRDLILEIRNQVVEQTAARGTV
jgi:hypothetical protein